MLNHDALSSFKDINTIIIKVGGPSSEIDFNRCIETTKQRLLVNDLAPSKERRYIRVWHESNDSYFQFDYESDGGIPFDDTIKRNIDMYAFVRGYYREIRI